MALWHGRMILGIPFHPGRPCSILVSPSDDGSISKQLLEACGYGVVRGSASRGGARAMRQMLGVLRNGGVLGITPDGPRGPRHSMNLGLAWMARATGFPVVPCGLAAERAWHARSWDRLTIAKPRARVVMAYGPAITVDRSGGLAALERATEGLREALLHAEEDAFRYLGVEPDW